MSFSPKIYGSKTYEHSSQDRGFLSQQNGSFCIAPPKEQMQVTAYLSYLFWKYKIKTFKSTAISCRNAKS